MAAFAIVSYTIATKLPRINGALWRLIFLVMIRKWRFFRIMSLLDIQELQTFNQWVPGSIPGGRTTFSMLFKTLVSFAPLIFMYR